MKRDTECVQAEKAEKSHQNPAETSPKQTYTAREPEKTQNICKNTQNQSTTDTDNSTWEPPRVPRTRFWSLFSKFPWPKQPVLKITQIHFSPPVYPVITVSCTVVSYTPVLAKFASVSHVDFGFREIRVILRTGLENPWFWLILGPFQRFTTCFRRFLTSWLCVFTIFSVSACYGPLMRIPLCWQTAHIDVLRRQIGVLSCNLLAFCVVPLFSGYLRPVSDNLLNPCSDCFAQDSCLPRCRRVFAPFFSIWFHRKKAQNRWFFFIKNRV